MNGHITLPVLLEMRKDPAFKQQIATLNHQTNPAEFAPIITRIRESYSIQQSKEISDKYLNKALNLIDQLNESNAQNLFIKLIKKWVHEMFNWYENILKALYQPVTIK